MNHRPFFFRLFVLQLTFILGDTFAQAPKADKPPSPPESFRLIAPEFCAWNESFTYLPPSGQSGTSPDPTFIKSISHKKTKALIFSEFVYYSGNKSWKWEIDKNVFLKPQGQKYWSYYPWQVVPKEIPVLGSSQPVPPTSLEALLRASKGPETLPLTSEGFSNLEWVNSTAFVGIAKLGDRDVWLFVHPLLIFKKSDNLEEVRKSSQYAVVDMLTNLPIEDSARGYTRKFSFLPPPTSIQTPPGDLIQEFKDGQRQKEKAQAMPPRGY